MFNVKKMYLTHPHDVFPVHGDDVRPKRHEQPERALALAAVDVLQLAAAAPRVDRRPGGAVYVVGVWGEEKREGNESVRKLGRVGGICNVARKTASWWGKN